MTLQYHRKRHMSHRGKKVVLALLILCIVFLIPMLTDPGNDFGNDFGDEAGNETSGITPLGGGVQTDSADLSGISSNFSTLGEATARLGMTPDFSVLENDDTKKLFATFKKARFGLLVTDITIESIPYEALPGSLDTIAIEQSWTPDELQLADAEEIAIDAIIYRPSEKLDDDKVLRQFGLPTRYAQDENENSLMFYTDLRLVLVQFEDRTELHYLSAKRMASFTANLNR